MSFIVRKRIAQGSKSLPTLLVFNSSLLLWRPYAQNRVMSSIQQPPVSKTKEFMKKYGYAGIGVYLALSAVDLTATIAIISVKGADSVRQAEDYTVGKVKAWLGMKHTPLDQAHGHEKPSFTSIFVIAYGIHKTVLLPFRLSLTAAITPAVARRLNNWGWFKNKLCK